MHEQHNDGGPVGCSSIWTSRIYGHIMMLTFYASQNPQTLTVIFMAHIQVFWVFVG